MCFGAFDGILTYLYLMFLVLSVSVLRKGTSETCCCVLGSSLNNGVFQTWLSSDGLFVVFLEESCEFVPPGGQNGSVRFCDGAANMKLRTET